MCCHESGDRTFSCTAAALLNRGSLNRNADKDPADDRLWSARLKEDGEEAEPIDLSSFLETATIGDVDVDDGDQLDEPREVDLEEEDNDRRWPSMLASWFLPPNQRATR